MTNRTFPNTLSKSVRGLGFIVALVSWCLSTSSETHAPPSPENALIKLSRTRCYGSCPSYSVEVNAAGEVKFHGFHFVKSEGLHIRNIPPEKVSALVNEIVSAGFMDLTQKEVDECPDSWTDSPTAHLLVKFNGNENTIKHYHGCRGKDLYQTLIDLESRVDEVLETEIWIKGPPFVKGQ